MGGTKKLGANTPITPATRDLCSVVWASSTLHSSVAIPVCAVHSGDTSSIQQLKKGESLEWMLLQAPPALGNIPLSEQWAEMLYVKTELVPLEKKWMKASVMVG